MTPVTMSAPKHPEQGTTMFRKVYQATHPDMMSGVDNETLRDRYLVTELFGADGLSLN